VLKFSGWRGGGSCTCYAIGERRAGRERGRVRGRRATWWSWSQGRTWLMIRVPSTQTTL